MQQLAAVLRIKALWRLHCCALLFCGYGEGGREALGEFARARLNFVEQPCVLDRDHRLVGKRFDQPDLIGAEWQWFGTC